jgi:hypothetical protein
VVSGWTVERVEAPSIIEPQELPYVSDAPTDGRSIIVAPYYDADARQFYGCHPMPDGKIAVLPLFDLVEGHYLAKCPANPQSDRDLPFSTVLLQHFSHREVWLAALSVQQDLTNALASVQKYFVILLYANEREDDSYGPMITTELEYAFVNHRAFYDGLNEIVRRILRHRGVEGRDLPESFAAATRKSERDLQEKHCLPPPLVSFYKEREAVFLKLRYVRDNILHHGHSPDGPFLLPDGIAVSVDQRLAQQLGDFALWPEALLKPHRLGSALAILAFVASDMSEVMDHLGTSLLSCFPDPPKPIACGYGVFLRSSVSRHLVSLDEYKRIHWFDPRKVLGTPAPANNIASLEW